MNDNKLLKNIRVRLGYTQRSFAKRLRVTQGAISHWERGVSYPSIPLATKIAKLAEKKGIIYTIKQLRGENG
jgi:DNA-binding XRE family transcriptional regulator